MDIEQEMTHEAEIPTHRLEHWAREAPERTFIYYGEEERAYSYQEFNALANSVAHSLAALGIGPGRRVAVFLKNPWVSALAMFAVWKIKALYCPINFNYRGRLLAYQLNDTAPALLITEVGLLPLLEEIGSEVATVPCVVHRPAAHEHDFTSDHAELRAPLHFGETAFTTLLDASTADPGYEIDYRAAANIIYTSGTTGPSKGVVQCHRWMNQYTLNVRQITHQDDVVYNDLPMYHVGGAIFHVVRAAYAGCEVALWDKFSVHEFWSRIRRRGASMTVLLDVMTPWLMSLPESPQDRENSLRIVHMQPMPQYHNQVARRFGFDFVTTGYGQTESGNGFIGVYDELEGEPGTPAELCKGYSREEVMATAQRMGFPVVSGRKAQARGYMGKPSAFLEAAILDEQDNPCPPEVLGQLCFRPRVPGVLMDAYFNKPDATVQAFRNLWFHTGDGCYRDAEDNYYFVDRMGAYIRTRGENISSYQVEDILNSHPEVEVSAVFPIPAEEGEEDDVAAYVVRKAGSSLDDSALREWLAGETPRYMIPRHLRFTDSLPRTPTNKIEKYKLKQELLRDLGRE